ncbi:RHS repeat-associated core domain-containing protein [Epilithonimonas sp.]|uniref:RHS repeat domain-containing protein n=1 Tax=Epilithonimonas sp. TaxID=2894511 RepID=UPI0028A17EF1|nr:RHS repeat-associated core domain-containing protein [Epilithonimonas sp.]
MVLSFFPTAEGFYDVENSKYILQYKDHLGNVRLSYAKDTATGGIEVLDRNDYYPFGMNFNNYYSKFDAMGSLHNYKYNGKELQETGMYDYGARQYLPDIGRWGVPDPLSEKHPDLNPMMYANNNPIRFVDPDGMDWVESKNGDVIWRDDVTAKNYKDKGVLQKGETYRGTYYERAKTWDNKHHKGLVLEMYHTSGKMDYSPAKEVNVGISGEMRNSKIGDVDVKLNATFENGKTKNIGSYEAVAGGFGNGAPENGEYTVDSYQDRSPNGWYNKGMNRDRVGFSFNLNPQFSTGRSLLRIHPDGNNEGTLGCIGMSGDKIVLTNFRDTLRSMIKTGGPVPVNINIQNNPNNNGRSGTKIPNVNE